jgi:hypothetical protein
VVEVIVIEGNQPYQCFPCCRRKPPGCWGCSEMVGCLSLMGINQVQWVGGHNFIDTNLACGALVWHGTSRVAASSMRSACFPARSQIPDAGGCSAVPWAPPGNGAPGSIFGTIRSDQADRLGPFAHTRDTWACSAGERADEARLHSTKQASGHSVYHVDRNLQCTSRESE